MTYVREFRGRVDREHFMTLCRVLGLALAVAATTAGSSAVANAWVDTPHASARPVVSYVCL